MGVLANMVTQSQPAAFGEGCEGGLTAGASWRAELLEMTDSTGAIVNLSTVTGTCTILTKAGGTTVASPAFAGASDGSFTLTLDESVTATLANSDATQRRCAWRLYITDGTDVVQMWGPTNSPFVIYPGA